MERINRLGRRFKQPSASDFNPHVLSAHPLWTFATIRLNLASEHLYQLSAEKFNWGHRR